ncbi:hypothetical protein RchiOBHm_Chr5g0005961 [Rosa chinensis]|uniref:Ribosomal protein L21 n=1 Tax=Rosa chinensis TaxID=74649 RepID=A0A2P6Q3F0_ROSCH|nr:hypothetical protein RchiOBHm_Chr5g0005961 [Rosa chinensis]
MRTVKTTTTTKLGTVVTTGVYPRVVGRKESTRRRRWRRRRRVLGYKVVGPLEKTDDGVFKPYEPVFAVIQIGSHQFKVSNADSIFTERLKFCEVKCIYHCVF